MVYWKRCLIDQEGEDGEREKKTSDGIITMYTE